MSAANCPLNESPEAPFVPLHPIETGPHLPGEDTSAEVDHGRWPDLSFEFNETNLFGNQTIPANDRSRLASAVSSLRGAVPGLFPEFTDSKNRHIHPADYAHFYRTKRYGDYFKSKVTVNQQQVQRSELYSLDDMLREYTAHYRDTNHPVIQFMNELAIINDLQKDAAEQSPNRGIAYISDYGMQNLCDNLIILTENEAARTMLTERLSAKRLAKIADFIAACRTMYFYGV